MLEMMENIWLLLVNIVEKQGCIWDCLVNILEKSANMQDSWESKLVRLGCI